MYRKIWNEIRVHVVTPLPTFVVKPFGVPARTFEYLMRPVT